MINDFSTLSFWIGWGSAYVASGVLIVAFVFVKKAPQS